MATATRWWELTPAQPKPQTPQEAWAQANPEQAAAVAAWQGYDPTQNNGRLNEAQMAAYQQTQASMQNAAQPAQTVALDPYAYEPYAYAQQWLAKQRDDALLQTFMSGIPADSARGKAATELFWDMRNVQNYADMFRANPEKQQAAQQYLMSGMDELERLRGYNNDEEYLAAKQADEAALETERRRANMDATEAAVQLERLKQERDALATNTNIDKYERLRNVTNAASWMTPAKWKTSAADIGEGYAAVAARYDNLNAQIKQLEDDLAAIQKRTSLNINYNRLTQNADFAEKSQYNPDNGGEARVMAIAPGEGGTGGVAYLGGGDALYKIINGDQEALRQRQQNMTAAGGAGAGGVDDYLAATYVTANERAIYNYLYAESKEKADEYFNLIKPELNARYRAAETQRYQKMAKENPLFGSVMSVVGAPDKMITFGGQVQDMLATGKIDQNAPYNRYANIPTVIRSQIAHDIERNYGRVGSFAYNTGMSIMENVYEMALTGGQAGTNYLLAIMGTAAAADGVIAAKDRGLTDGQAMVVGLASGAIEAATEKIGLDALYDGIFANVGNQTRKTALIAILKSALAEGGEEVAGTYLDDIADVIIAGADSERARLVAQYKAQGMSEDEALRLAYRDLHSEAGMAGLSGAISGVVLSGGGQVLVRGYNAAARGALRAAGAATNALEKAAANRITKLEGKVAEETAQTPQEPQTPQPQPAPAPRVTTPTNPTTGEYTSLDPDGGEYRGWDYTIDDDGDGHWTAQIFNNETGEAEELTGEYTGNDRDAWIYQPLQEVVARINEYTQEATPAPQEETPEVTPQDVTEAPQTEETPQAVEEPAPAPTTAEPAPQNVETTPEPKTPAPQADRVTYKTGEGTTVTAFHGKGKTRAEIYAWTQTPIAGDGTYYALTEKRAKQYGDDVTASEVTVKNPLVINDDTDWINLIREAGWRNANPYGMAHDEVVEMTKRLKNVILSKGHDSLIVQYEKYHDGDMNSKTRGWVKVIDNVFGHDQIVVYDTASNPNVQPKAAPTEFSKADVEKVLDALDPMESEDEDGYWFGDYGDYGYAITDEGDGHWSAMVGVDGEAAIELEGDYDGDLLDAGGPNSPMVQVARAILELQARDNERYAESEEDVTKSYKSGSNTTRASRVNPRTDKGGTKGAYGGSDYQGSPQNWRTTRTQENKAEAKPLNALIEQIRTRFGLHIGTGNINSRGAAATYNTRDHDIRLRISEDLERAAHELGHHIDQIYGDISAIKQPDVQKDLEKAYSREFRDDTYPANQHASEGFAQYLKYFLTNKEQAETDFPYLTKAFLNALTPADLAFFEQFADEVNAYMSTDVADRPMNVWTPGTPRPDTRTKNEKRLQKANQFYQRVIDRAHGIKLAELKLGGNGMAYNISRVLPYARNTASYCLTNELVDLNGQRIGDSLKTALTGVDMDNLQECNDFGDYLVALHAPERLANQKQVAADAFENSKKFYDQKVADLDAKYPQFAEAAKRVIEFEKNVIKTYGIDSGLISRQTVRLWNKLYPHHVPLYRLMDDTGKGYGSRGQTDVTKAFQATARFGSGRTVINPVFNIIDETLRLVTLSKQNSVLLELRKLARGGNADATVMTKINPKKAVTFSGDVFKTDLKRTGDTMVTAAALTGDADFMDIIETVVDELVDSVKDTYTIFKRGNGGANVVPIMVNGKAEMWQVNDQLLLESLQSMTPKQVGYVAEAYGKISRFITSHLTGGDIVWSLSRNAPKDFITWITLMKDKKHLKQMLGNYGVAYLNRLKEFTQSGQIHPFAREYYALGGGTGVSRLSSGTDEAARQAKASLSGNTARARLMRFAPWEMVSFVSDMVESGPRCATYITLRENGVDPQTAFKEAMESTVDFARGGVIGREANRFIPFFNASLQGADRFVRYLTAEDVAPEGKEARVKAIRARMIGYTTASFLQAAIVYALNHATKKRKEEYQALSNYVKNTSWVIPIGNGKFFAIPKAREVNVMASMFEQLGDAIFGGNEHALDEFYGYAVDQFFPGVVSDFAKLPQNVAQKGLSEGIENSFGDALGALGLIGVISNVRANRDFLGRPIVSQTYENGLAKDQYSGTTSRLAYWIGQATGLSPMKLDYVGKNVLGYLWKYPALLFPVEQEKADYSLGIVGTYVKDSAYSTDITNRLYDRADRTAKKSRNGSWDEKVTAKMDDRWTTIYATFNKLNRMDASDTARDDREVVLAAISEYLKGAEHGVETDAQKFIRDTCIANEDTRYLPSALSSTIKLGTQKVELTASEYWFYQMRYMELYYKYLAVNSTTHSASAMASACNTASDKAKAQAQRDVLAERAKTNALSD